MRLHQCYQATPFMAARGDRARASAIRCRALADDASKECSTRRQALCIETLSAAIFFTSCPDAEAVGLVAVQVSEIAHRIQASIDVFHAS